MGSTCGAVQNNNNNNKNNKERLKNVVLQCKQGANKQMQEIQKLY